jgi:hypothetical protein
MPGSSGVGSADFPTNAAIFDDDASGGDGNHDKSYLLFPNTIGAVDLTDYLDMQITLEYEYALNTLDPADDTLELFISNGEGGFILVKSYGVDTDITLDSVDVTQLLADNPGMDVTNFFFKFVYDDIDSDYSWGAGVDNVRLIATPVNDLCEDAIELTIGGSFNDYDVEGTLFGSSAELHLWVDVWYSVVVPSTGGFVVETAQAAGSVMDDTWMEVHSGSCGSLTEIAYSDNDGEGSFSKITITGQTPGDVLYVHVGKDASYSGVLDTFLISAYAIPPANDLCEDAIPLTVGGEFDDYDVEGTLLGSGAELYGWVDVWYSVVVPESGEVVVETAQAPGSVMDDTWIRLFSGSCGSLTTIATSDDDGEGLFSKITVTGQTPGDVLYLHVGKDGAYTGALDSFLVSAYATPPINDLCTNAVSLTVGDDFDDHDVIATLAGAQDEDSFGSWSDVFFTFVVPASGYATVETAYASGSAMHSTFMFVYSGACGSLVELGDDSGSGDGDFSKIELSGLTPGETLHIKIEELEGTPDPMDTFLISVYDPTVSIAETVIDGFNIYPNPVKDVLNLTAQNKIDFVSIYNLLGQEVLSVAPSAATTQVDMSYLPTGAYIVKVQAGDQIGSYNLIKE